MKRIVFGIMAAAVAAIAAGSAMAQPPAIVDGPIPAKPTASPVDGCCLKNCCIPSCEKIVRHIPEWSCRCEEFCLPQCNLWSMLQSKHHHCGGCNNCGCDDTCEACTHCHIWKRKVYLKFDTECEEIKHRCAIVTKPVEHCCTPACPPACPPGGVQGKQPEIVPLPGGSGSGASGSGK
jgi:hypothetical protein